MGGSRILPLLLLLAGAALAVSPTLAQEDESEPSWPRKLTGERGEIIIYQPQVESFAGNTLESRAAVSVQAAGSEAPVFGAVWLSARLVTDLETRMATLESIKVTAARFPDVEQAKVDELSAYLEQEIPKWDMELSIDRLVASLPENEQSGAGQGFKNDPPHIYHRTVPAVLVSIDGEPRFKELEGFDLEYVANTAFFMVREKGGGLLYLRGSGMWFAAGGLEEPWELVGAVPSSLTEVTKKLEEDEAAQAAEQAEDAKELELEKATDEPLPEIIVTTVPAELIVTEGDPDFASVEGTQLLYLKNTESDVIMDIASQKYYVLMAGRWFRGSGLETNDWEWVDFDDLPADFAAIPADSDLGNVLPSVAGTVESKEAILETSIPQTAEVDRKTATCEVTYDGDPQFESCAEGVAYALNTEKSVLLIDDRYYCCDEAVWFVSGGPEGPWTVATEVPAVVQDLPPECPVYNVKYVYIYDSTPEVVYVGYTSGYYGSYVYGSCVVYGTGWYYYPWYGYYYYPRAVTYGWGVHYNPWTGWGFHYGVSYGWVHIGVGWGRPYYSCWGVGGYRYGYRRGYWHGYNRGYRHGYRRGAARGYRAGYHAGQRNRHSNAYRNRSDGVKRTGDTRNRDGKRPATTGGRNNVYADRNGDVYRDKGDGSWEKREDGNWSEDRGDRDREGNQDRSREQDRDSGTRDNETRDRDQGTRDRDQGNRDQGTRDRDQGTRDRDQGSRDRNQQLDRDRSSRDRGNQRQQQSPNRGSRGGSRGGGGRRR